MTSDQVQSSLIRYLSMRNFPLLMPNVFILNSPWESDLIKINKSMTWYEYEVKTSRSDFFQDFRKMTGSYFTRGVNKHDFLSSGREFYCRRIQANFPRPKQFFFVTPKGLVKPSEVPGHCGLIEVSDNGLGRYNSLCSEVIRKAPHLKSASKMTNRQLWNISAKVSSRFVR